MKPSKIKAGTSEVEEIEFSAIIPPRKKNDMEEPGKFNDEDEDFDLELDNDLDTLDNLDLDEEEDY